MCCSCYLPEMFKNWNTSSLSWIRKNRSGYKIRFSLSVHWRYIMSNLNLKNILFLFIGRFDLSYPEFKCSECEGVMKAAENHLISSRWWPGSPKKMRRPLAMHIDGIMKLYRWLSSKGLEMQEFLYDFILESKF